MPRRPLIIRQALIQPPPQVKKNGMIALRAVVLVIVNLVVAPDIMIIRRIKNVEYVEEQVNVPAAMEREAGIYNYKLSKTNSMNNSSKQLSVPYFSILMFVLIVAFSAPSAWSQPRGKFIYSGSYDYNGNKVSKQTNYTTLFVTPYNSGYQTWLKVQGVTKSGQRYNLPSSSGRYVFTKYRSGFSVYAYDEQTLIVNDRQNVIQFYRDITSGKYDEFIYYWD